MLFYSRAEMETSPVTYSLRAVHGKSGSVLAGGKETGAFIWLIVLILPDNTYFQASACVAGYWAFTSENAAKLSSVVSSFWSFPLSLTKLKLLCKSGGLKLPCGICLSYCTITVIVSCILRIAAGSQLCACSVFSEEFPHPSTIGGKARFSATLIPA